MFSYRITKYNPAFRNPEGAYLKNDWTSVSEIGKTFDSKPLTQEEYLQTEDAYVKAIMLFMDYLNLPTLKIIRLSKHDLSPNNNYPESLIKTYEMISKGQEVNPEQVGNIARLALREEIGCQLQSNKKMFVHFGYDYYMYIGSSKALPDSLKNEIEKTGLFVEEFESPYL